MVKAENGKWLCMWDSTELSAEIVLEDLGGNVRNSHDV